MAQYTAANIPSHNNNFMYDAKYNRFVQNDGNGGFSNLNANELYKNDAIDWDGWLFEGQGSGKKQGGLWQNITGQDPGWTDEAIKSRNAYAEDWLWQNEVNRLGAGGFGDDLDSLFYSPGGTFRGFGTSDWDQDEYGQLFSRGLNVYAPDSKWVDRYGLNTFMDMGLTPEEGEVGYTEYQQGLGDLASTSSTANPAINPSTGLPYDGAEFNLETGEWGMPANAVFRNGAIVSQQTPEEIQADKDAAAVKEQADRDFMMQMIAAQQGGSEGGGMDVSQMMQLMEMLFSRYNNQSAANQNYGYPGQSFGGSQWLIGPNSGYYDYPTAFNF